MNYELQKELNAALKNLLQCSREFYENSNPGNYANLLKKKTHAIHDCDNVWRKIFKDQYPFRTLCSYCDSPEHNEIEHVCPERHSEANFWKNPPEGVSFYPKKLMIVKTHEQYAEKTAGHLRFCELRCGMSIEPFSEEISQEELFEGEIDAPVSEDSIPEYEHYFCPPIDRFILNNLAPVGVQEVEKVHQKKVIRSLFLAFGQFNNGNTIFQRTTNDNGNYRVRGHHAHTIYDHELCMKYGKARR